MASTTSNNTDTLPPPQLFTVANVIIDDAKPNEVSVAFFESARYYSLLRSNQQFAVVLSRLQQAKIKRQPVQVYLTQAYGDIIKNVTIPKKKRNV